MDLNKKKRNYLVPIIAGFCVIYIIFALKPMTDEIKFSPEWTKDIYQVTENDGDEELIPFKLAQNIGYFTKSGKIVSNISFPSKAAISATRYSTFVGDNTDADFYTPQGEKAGTIHISGFPYFDEDRIFVFLPGGNSFAKCDSNGIMEWSFEHFSPITAFSSTQNGILAGFANGSLVSFYNDGKVKQEFAPGGSDISVILGAAVSHDGTKVACLSGQNQQRFVVAENNSSHSKVIFHEYLPEEVTRQSIVKFNNKDNVVFYNFKNGLGIVDINKLESKKISVKGRVTQIEFSDSTNLVFVLSRDGDIFTVTTLEDNSHFVSKFSFKGKSSFILTKDDSLFIGRDSKISQILISRR